MKAMVSGCMVVAGVWAKMPTATCDPPLSPGADRGDSHWCFAAWRFSDIMAKTGCHLQLLTISIGGESRDASATEVSLGASRHHGHEAMPAAMHHHFYQR